MNEEIKIFRLNDYDWWAGRSLEECKADAIENHCYSEDNFDDPREITGEEMAKFIFVEEDEDDYTKHIEKPFRQKLDELIADGAEFPDMFATTEF